MSDRHRVAVELVAATHPRTVLELGCGTGIALEMAAEELPDAHLTGIDRSATAIARAAARLEPLMATARVGLVHAAIADLRMPPATVDVAFAVNVNIFWTSDAEGELAVLDRVLRPGGELHLVVEPPLPDPRVRARTEETLDRAGWRTSVVLDGGLVAVSATPAS